MQNLSTWKPEEKKKQPFMHEFSPEDLKILTDLQRFIVAFNCIFTCTYKYILKIIHHIIK